jgi:hypothetical protein
MASHSGIAVGQGAKAGWLHRSFPIEPLVGDQARHHGGVRCVLVC